MLASPLLILEVWVFACMHGMAWPGDWHDGGVYSSLECLCVAFPVLCMGVAKNLRS